jgi:LysM repeat protein
MPYTVKSGDTLSKIARRNGVTLAKLLDANPKFKPNPDKLRVGDVLNLPGEAVAATKPKPQPTLTATRLPQPQPSATRELGGLSAKYETSGRGPGTVSTGKGDKGGVSYGSYQMTSRPGGGTVGKFVSQEDFEFADEFDGLVPGSDEFSDAWEALAESNPDEFQAAQHEYIKRTHFDPLVRKLVADDGLNVLTRSRALQDVIWSTAVQHGGATSIPSKALAKVNLAPEDGGFDHAFITAIYQERGRKRADGALMYFSKNSTAVQAGVAKRFRSELKDALQMLADEA